MKNNITILGTGAWGTALANVLASSKNNIVMWGIDTREIQDINNGYNKKYFGNKLNKNIRATLDIEEALKSSNYVVLAIPSKYQKEVLLLNSEKFKNKPIFINVAKGLDYETMRPLSDTLKNILEGKNSGICSLIGPSFAIDVMNKKPTVINCVCSDENVSKKICSLFNTDYFKVIPIKDEIGAEICGALKNLLAIGIGMAHENHDSINTISAILTLGIKEVEKIIEKFGGKKESLIELAGIGDIFLTCTSKQSRNFTFGNNLYKYGLYKAIERNKSTVEGFVVYKIVQKAISRNEKDFPIFSTICLVLEGKVEPKKFVKTCLNLIGIK